jgi:hypothetical protein
VTLPLNDHAPAITRHITQKRSPPMSIITTVVGIVTHLLGTLPVGGLGFLGL